MRKILFPVILIIHLFISLASAEEQNRNLSIVEDDAADQAVPSDNSPYRATWIVTIGINDYFDDNVPDLRYAVADANAVAEALVKKYNVPKEHVLALYDRNATKRSILRALSSLRDERRVSADDRVIVFFAGHGETLDLPRGGRLGYLVPTDADPTDLIVTGVSMDELKRASSYIPARHVLFLVDSCYSGIAGSTRALNFNTQTAPPMDRLLQEHSRQMITAGGRGEKVIEDERWGHSVFTYNLLKGLEGFADTDGDGFILTTELYSFVKSRVIRDAEGKQAPQMFTLDGEGELLFELENARRQPGHSPQIQSSSFAPSPQAESGDQPLEFATINVQTGGDIAPWYSDANNWYFIGGVLGAGLLAVVICNPEGGEGGDSGDDGSSGGSSGGCAGPGEYFSAGFKIPLKIGW